MPQTPILPSTIGNIILVLVSNMTLYVYRNLRFGFYRDHSITSFLNDRALQGSSHPHHEIVFKRPRLEDSRGGDMEAGDSVNEVTGSINASKEQVEIYRSTPPPL